MPMRLQMLKASMQLILVIGLCDLQIVSPQYLRAAGLMAYIPRNSIKDRNTAWDVTKYRPGVVSVQSNRDANANVNVNAWKKKKKKIPHCSMPRCEYSNVYDLSTFHFRSPSLGCIFDSVRVFAFGFVVVVVVSFLFRQWNRDSTNPTAGSSPR